MALDDETVREFLESSHPRLVAAVALVAGSREAAEDAVQEALARAWERSGTEQIRSLPAWVTRVALNLSRSRWRRLRAEAKATELLRQSSDPPLPESGPDVRQALARLSRRQREVTVLRYYLGTGVGEIAGVLGSARERSRRSCSELVERWPSSWATVSRRRWTILPGFDDRLTRELERVAHPADPTGVLDRVGVRRARRVRTEGSRPRCSRVS